ncbi:maleylpyruvate isomerase family mycothiol-dependent enzyme [Actinokineospora bangkokensis]|uniref:Maleylpyruvate isomerase family mycothiol-dependent enzyme n=1 Tax=Actinokineospora bangkokensis TaxID=1193682 RepID=A0A1Q9LJE8_9PSEU|nr:maleylpyruvate isomerase family mycothiol-dependent enzyme [Actinokineospora bangkokensis]OLR92171.1 hypothetical protein BJP25_22835 [Actinokineospora bangkokensis]
MSDTDRATAPLDHAALFAEYNRRLVAAVERADPAAPVPTCPEWTTFQLAKHVGRGDRWAATMVRDRATEVLEPRDVPGGRPPEGGLVEWLGGGPALLAEATAATGADHPVWTFTGPRPAAWWTRRRLHECVVHYADAALALGEEPEIAPEVAEDAVSEWLELLAARGADLAPMTLHLHDGAGPEWFVRGGPALTWERAHAKGDVALRGSSADLLLVLLRRKPVEAVDLVGDRAAWDRWVAATPF